ncbi:MAG: N-methyl-L-tryptophan oxidase [Verrucomicrobiales bacterium]|nr:N-methyl-L-tryptophan oxidase [Verrucomicrobiales bacterium]
MPTWEVIVVGLGGMGSAVVAHLARRGQRVLGLDRHAPPHDRGSSHGMTRVIRQAYFEHPAYVPLLLRAYDLWRELESEEEQPLLLLPGGLMMGAPDSAVVQGSLGSARRYGLAHDALETRDLRRRFPQFVVPDGTVALFEKAAGLVYCERAIEAHLRRATRHGAALSLHEPVISWRETVSGVEVVTSKRRLEAGQLVITPGPWAPELLRDLGVPFTVERQVLAWFEPSAGVEPFLPDRFPIYIWERTPDCTPYGFPAVDGATGGVKIALYRSPEIEVCTPETVDRTWRARDESRLRAVAAEFLPGLGGRLVKGAVCLYTLTPDLNFVIDRHPGTERVTVAAGFSGHGYKFCSVVGEVVADLVTTGRSPFDLSLFRAARFGTVASGSAGPTSA